MPKTRSAPPLRDETGKLKSECRCILHEDSGGDVHLFRLDQRKIPASLIEYARSNEFLPARANFVCSNCVARLNKLKGGEDSDPDCIDLETVEVDEDMNVDQIPMDHTYGADNSISILVAQVCQHLQNGQVSCEDRSKLAQALGESESDAVASDMERNLYTSAESLVNNRITEWMSHRNKTIKAFLKGITRCKYTASQKKGYAVAKAVESIYYAKDLTYIGPLAFSENLIQYSVSGSKFSTMVAGASSASPSYTTVLKWLNSQSTEGQAVPKNDCVIAFDNNQKLQKTYQVSMNSTLKNSTITNVMSLSAPGPSTSLQFRPDLKPGAWRIPLSVMEFRQKDGELERICSATMARFQAEFFEQRLDGVKLEVLGQCDAIDRLALEEQRTSSTGKTCETCHAVHPNRMRKCQVCQSRLVPARSMRDKANDVDIESVHQFAASSGFPSNHPEDVPRAVIHEPCLVNPNSCASMATVLGHIKELCIKDGREWVEVVCDGSPFTMIANQIMTSPHEFDWLMLRPGLGHVEINAFKSMFNLSWDVFMEAVAQLLSFRSEKALSYAKSASDHHKSWEMILIAVHGTTDELMVPYVRLCAERGVTPTIAGFEEFIYGSGDDTLLVSLNIIKKMVALLALRTGVRRNNTDLINAARRAIQPLWFGLNHPKYRLLEFFSRYESFVYPEEVRQYTIQTDSFCMNDDGKGEAPDFILEEKNKGTKKWVVGTPTNEMWRRVCNNFNLFEAIRENLMDSLGMKDPADRQGNPFDRDVRREILGWRIKLRAAEYLNPSRGRGLVGFSGARLSEDLLRLDQIASGNFDLYVNSMIFRGRAPSIKCIDIGVKDDSDSEDEYL